jgi:hypothetical protein
MTDFTPTRFMRLVKRISRPNLGIQELILDDNVEDPNCTLVPVMEEHRFLPSNAWFQINGKTAKGVVRRWTEHGEICIEIGIY